VQEKKERKKRKGKKKKKTLEKVETKHLLHLIIKKIEHFLWSLKNKQQRYVEKKL
jgi:hypothetical protein